MDAESNLKKVCTCPNCGANMKIINDGSTSYYVCSECGCSIYAEDQNYDCQDLCPSCNQALDGNECSYCGYDLGSDFD
jgi:ssDNA-binding Zn-finger/Zn-ribbon topoisomerase 1